MADSPCKRQCLRPGQTLPLETAESQKDLPLASANFVAAERDLLLARQTRGPIDRWPLEMTVYMMSGSPLCKVFLDSLDMHIPEIKHLIQTKTGIPWSEQDIFLDGCTVVMQNECRLCHYADALYGAHPSIYLVRKSPLAKELGRSTWRRLQKESQNLHRSHALVDCSLKPLDLETNPLKWTASIDGAVGSPYEGGRFFLDILLPHEYPYKPPLVLFTTPVFHPLVALRGSIELDLLHEKWLPVVTLEQVILRIKQELANPYCSQVACGNHEAALLSHDRDGFDHRARQETLTHASIESVCQFDRVDRTSRSQ